MERLPVLPKTDAAYTVRPTAVCWIEPTGGSSNCTIIDIPEFLMRDFNRHLFGLGTSPSVAKTLNVRRGGVVRPFAARYILRTNGMIVPAAVAVDMFVPIVHMTPRPACNVFIDGKHVHRPATMTGTVLIRDRRVSSYADSTVIDNVSFYMSFADLTRMVDQAGGRKIDAFPHLLDRAQDDPILYRLAQTSEAAMDHASEVAPLFLDQLYNTVCAHVAATYGGMAGSAQPFQGGLSFRQEARVRDLLLSDLRGDVSLARLAALCDLSERHFSRAFKQSVGASPHRWLLYKRIERAQAMLKDSNVAISQIALDCGFAGQSHLGRVFTKVVGTSPGAWRRAQQD